MGDKSEDKNNYFFDVDVDCKEDPEELRKKLINLINTANEEFAEKFYEDNQDEIDTIHQLMHCLTVKPTEDEHIMEMKIPCDAYDEDGDLKESYRKAYNTIIEENRRNNKELLKNAIEEVSKPEPVEIGDKTSFSIKYVIDDLIDNTGILESCTLTFKKTLTPTLLQTLSQYRTLLTEENLKWRIEDHDMEYVRIILENN